MATKDRIPADEEDNNSLVNKSLYLVGGIDDALGTINDVYKANDRKRNTKKKGLLKTSFSVKLASDLLNKKRTRKLLKLLTGKDIRGLTSKHAKLLGYFDRALKGDVRLLAKLLPDEYQELFSRIAKIDAVQKRLFNTKSGKRRYNNQQIAKRNRADNLHRDLVERRARRQGETTDGIRSIQDNQVEGNLYGDVIREYSDLDDPNEVLDVIREIDDEDLKKEVGIIATGDLANRGHIDAITSLIDEGIVNVEAIVSRYPDIILRIVKGFKINFDDRLLPLPDIGESIITLLVKINPKWNVMLRADSEVTNYKLYQLMSKDCSNAIIAFERSTNAAGDISLDVHTAPAIMGANITTIPLENLLAKQFPDIPFSFR